MPPKVPYADFATRLIDAMTVAGHGAHAGSWSRIPVEIEPLRREAGAKSLTTARKYLEGLAFPRRHRLERIAEWLASGSGPRHEAEREAVPYDLPGEALALAKAWWNLPRHYREPLRSWIIMASIMDHLPDESKVLPAAAQGLERRRQPRTTVRLADN